MAKECYRIIDATPPPGTTYDDYSVSKLTDKFSEMFVEAADETADFYLLPKV